MAKLPLNDKVPDVSFPAMYNWSCPFSFTDAETLSVLPLM
ncbi:Uncharacterised protein [Vibrio cholerae]|nr:Uncharacterised protein [Vibrio cholerae]